MPPSRLHIADVDRSNARWCGLLQPRLNRLGCSISLRQKSGRYIEGERNDFGYRP